MGPRRYGRAGAGLLIAGVLFAVSYVAVSWAYGAFDEDYELVGRFPRAGQGLLPGSDVKYRGVNVGEVGSVELVDRQAEITLRMEPGFEVPLSAEVIVRPKTIFGEKFVDMSFEQNAPGPVLGDGDRIPDAQSATEVEDFVDGANDLFEALDQEEVATLVSELVDAAQGNGDDVARAIDSSAEVSEVFADTLEPQLDALDSFAAFQNALRDVGPDLNAISANSNRLLPEFNANADAYRRVLTTLRPFAEDLARLIAGTRPDIDTILGRGDNVVRVLLAREDNIAEVVNGLGKYVQTFAGGLSAERLPDGSGFAYFKAFLPDDLVQTLICTALDASPTELAGLRDAVLGFQSALDCSDFFDPSDPAVAGTAPERTPAERAASARQVVDDLYGQVGAPDESAGVDVGTLIDGLVTPP